MSALVPGGARKKDVDGRVQPGHDEKSGPVTTDFAQVVYENLKAAGVQNTKKGETLKFEWLKPFASRSGLIQFEGRYEEKGKSKRAAICIGPEYDTVGYELCAPLRAKPPICSTRSSSAASPSRRKSTTHGSISVL